MNFIYADSGLVHNSGHHAQSGREIVGELRRRGISATVLAHRTVKEELRVELDAKPHFDVYTYLKSSPDILCGWLNDFHDVAEATAQNYFDLESLVDSDTILHVNSAQGAQLYAIALWWRSGLKWPRPVVMIELGIDPGLQPLPDRNGQPQYGFPDPRSDPRALLYRFAACQLSQAGCRPIFYTFTQASSDAYHHLLGCPVYTLPLPRRASVTIRNRRDAKPITVAFLGEQRGEKGFHLVPEIVRQLLATTDCRVLVHNSRPDSMKREQEELRAMIYVGGSGIGNGRLILDEEESNAQHWQLLLDASDLIVLPYNERFRLSYSSIAVEALANGIPVLAPEGSTMATMSEEFNQGLGMNNLTPAGIVETIQLAIGGWSGVAEDAHAAAHRWAERHGPGHMVDALLALAKGQEGNVEA